MTREVLLLIGRDGQVLWSDTSHDVSALYDSRARWDAIWGHRAQLAEIAHSHPAGALRFSAEDESTMSALGLALAELPVFSIVTPLSGPGQVHMLRRAGGLDVPVTRADEPWWADLLRLASGMDGPRAEE
jgi:hypothetical protein